MEKIINRDCFDFEIGYITKSPCLNCEKRHQIPKCHDQCDIIDTLQTLLARGISSSHLSSHDV